MALTLTTSKLSRQHRRPRGRAQQEALPLVSGLAVMTARNTPLRTEEGPAGPSRALRQGWRSQWGEGGLARPREKSLPCLGQTGSPTSVPLGLGFAFLNGAQRRFVHRAVVRLRPRGPQRSLPLGSWHSRPHLKYVGGSAPASAPSCPLMHTSVHAHLFFYHVVLANADFLDQSVCLQKQKASQVHAQGSPRFSS